MGDSPAQRSNNVPCKAACITRWGGGGGWIGGGGCFFLKFSPSLPDPCNAGYFQGYSVSHNAQLGTKQRTPGNVKIQCNKGVVKPEKPHKVVKKEARIKSRGELGHIKAVLKGMCVYVRFESHLHVQ